MSNKLLDAVVEAIKEKPAEDPRVPKPVEKLATAEEIAAVVHEADLDLTAVDAAERDYSVYLKRVNDDSTNGERIVLARMAAAFPEVNQALFVPNSFHQASYFIDQIRRGLYDLARAKMSQIMGPHVEPLQKLWAQIADILEAAADAKIEAESKAFKIAESDRQSKERAAFDASARHRYLKGHDDQTFNFVPTVFKPSDLPARLLATAARLRQFKYIPQYGNRPFAAPLHGLLAQALLSHPGGK